MSDRSPYDPAFATLLLDSHRRVVGTELCPPEWSDDAEAAAWLQDKAPFGLLAHDLSADPEFAYANHIAQHCFGYTWEEFIGLPSRLSAAPDGQSDRNAFVEAVNLRGFADGYRGCRVRKDGSHFWIEHVTMWDLIDTDGTRHGQAAVFRAWTEATAQV
ncbi:MEKHLA domain-containing protein [Streptomyces sp. S.PB5]|uniref:MEKHLA domain-containing protein n=1 Tax=Streptomyces sp. S.PB5 TaxID=3020844 RepID=UPI0025AF37EB|nr:MEKHLA domain-containing protein [Streptomyces sp. S.PB5]MDN3029666.1 MEKHLA domain-containing protein [Streptomyces sp. S.PB5]